MRKKLELTREDIVGLTSKLTEKERYTLGIGAVLDGVVWPGMVGTGDHARLVSELCRLRLVCVEDELALRHLISTTRESEESLSVQAFQVRPGIMQAHPLLLDFLMNMARETLTLHAPLAPEGAKVGVREGLRGDALDVIMQGMGYSLGEGARMQALRTLEERGEVRSTSASRWNAVSRLWPLQDAAQARAFHRFCFLTMLDRVVAQRYAGMPNVLWLMGFNETQAGRHALGKRLSEGAIRWLESKSQSLVKGPRGGEAELVWVQTAVMIARRPQPKLPLPEWLKRELELTVLPATLIRLGTGNEGTRYFKRALTERAARWVTLERRRRNTLRRRKLPPGPLPKGLDIKWDTLKRWREYGSFESGELRGTLERSLVPVAMTRVQNLLQEALPVALTMRQIYDHALQHWPVEFHCMELLRHASDQLVAAFQAAETRILGPQRALHGPNWMKGYKAISLALNYPDLTPDYCKSLTEFLSEILQCLAEPEPEEPPFIETARYLIRRDELVAFREYMSQLRDEQLERLNSLSGKQDLGDMSAIGAVFTTIRRLPVNL